jgi:hypothetical protein
MHRNGSYSIVDCVFVVAGMCLTSRYLAMDLHITICYNFILKLELTKVGSTTTNDSELIASVSYGFEIIDVTFFVPDEKILRPLFQVALRL